MVQWPLSSAGGTVACWYLLGSDGLYVNSEVSRPYFQKQKAQREELEPQQM